MGLKQKTISGLFWSFSDDVLKNLVHFVVGIILARLLTPAEFGLIGMITVFIAVSNTFINSGFSQALIRKKNASDTDFSTIFYFNLLIALVFYLILHLSSSKIGNFYNEPDLVPITKVYGLILIINSFGFIQQTLLTKKINFKLQTKISFTASVISGTVAIYLAYNDFGVWSLVWSSILSSVIVSLMLWTFNGWFPRLVFSIESFRSLFAFGSKLLVAGLIDTLYRNIYLLIIGKVFSAADLGFYTRANKFKELPSRNITSTINRVTYPVLSTLQDDPVKLKTGYKKMIKSSMFITFNVMLIMAAVAEPMVLLLIGEQWLPSVSFLQLLCFSGMLYPLHAMNLNILKVKGRSDLFLRLEIFKKLLAVPVILIGVFIGIHAMIIGMVFNSVISYFINSYYSGKMISYSVNEQITDIAPSFLIAFSASLIIYSYSVFVELNPFLMLLTQGLIAMTIIVFVSEKFGLEGYIEIKNIIFDKISTILRYGKK